MSKDGLEEGRKDVVQIQGTNVTNAVPTLVMASFQLALPSSLAISLLDVQQQCGQIKCVDIVPENPKNPLHREQNYI